MEAKRQSRHEEGKLVGNFPDVTGPLLPLFDQAGSSRRWREVFGLERRQPRRGATPLTDREER